MDAAKLESFCKRLPKVELHAHLSGSIHRECLHKIWFQRKITDPSFPLDDPLEVIPATGITDLKSFFPLFSKYIYYLCNNIEAIKYSTKSVLEDFQSDGVAYLELRTTPRHFPETGLTKEDYVETVLEVISEYEKTSKSGMSTALILSVDRRDGLEAATHCVDLAIRYKGRGVVGVDLCGDPLKGNVGIFREIFAKAKAAGLGLTFHFGEAALTSSDDELLMLLAFQPDRLGHVIYASDLVKREIVRQKLALELCISCNVQIRMDPRVQAHHEHHFGEWWKEKTNPLIICTDDVGIFCSTCSNEYFLVAKNFKLSELELWELAFGTIGSIFNTEETKERLRELFMTWKMNEGL